jgi:hypothetical protein
MPAMGFITVPVPAIGNIIDTALKIRSGEFELVDTDEKRFVCHD